MQILPKPSKRKLGATFGLDLNIEGIQCLKEVRPEDNSILLYKDENGKTNVSVRFADEDVWVTQVQLAELYETTQQNVSFHIDNIYKDGELPRESTHKDFLLVRQEGKRNVQRKKIASYKA
ncbi:hypothetical protein MMG03_002579 [Fibrobacter succinogenes]|nr:hypothetical protein [Fibrobacter succinogenes]